MSNTNSAAEVAAKRYVYEVCRPKDLQQELNDIETFLAGYTAALSNGLKWTKIDAENLPEGGRYVLGGISKTKSFYMSMRESWMRVIANGYTHYLNETDLLTKIPTE